MIGVIGAYNSGCSDVQIPVANQAPDGPLAMISTSNTWNGLTRPYEGVRRGELEARYPSGVRNYVRIAAADHLQSVANATLVKELGLRDLFVLSPDGDRYFTADVRRAAHNLGLRIVGAANWNTEAPGFRASRDVSPGPTLRPSSSPASSIHTEAHWSAISAPASAATSP